MTTNLMVILQEKSGNSQGREYTSFGHHDFCTWFLGKPCKSFLDLSESLNEKISNAAPDEKSFIAEVCTICSFG